MGIMDKSIDTNAEIDPSKIIGGLGGRPLRENKHYFYVDGDNGNDSNSGRTIKKAKKTIQSAVTAASNWDVIYVFPLNMASGATDPSSYAETVIIPADKEGLAIIGAGTGRTQGGLPQVRIGAGSTAMFTIRAPSVLIANIGINGAGSTGGGILLDDDSSTKTAFGATILNCHFKNCKGSAAAATGGAVMWTTSGGAWQVAIKNSLFYNNRCGITMRGTGVSVPQDVVIENCDFTSSVNTNIDADIYVAADGIIGLLIKDCDFGTVDVPAYATSPDAARYIKLGAGTKGSIANCRFACISQGTGAKTFGAAGDACIVPTTVRMIGCYGEPASDATGDSGDIYRT